MERSTAGAPIGRQTLTALTKIIPLLSSDKEGERLAAIAAIDRILKNSGHDWHDFNACILAGPQAMPAASDKQEKPRRHEPWRHLFET
jgi:hypothetical protein